MTLSINQLNQTYLAEKIRREGKNITQITSSTEVDEMKAESLDTLLRIRQDIEDKKNDDLHDIYAAFSWIEGL